MRVTQRLVKAEKQAAREAGALVLYKTDEQRARERMLEVFPEVTEEHKPFGGELDEVGYFQGQARGDQAGIA